MSRLWDPLVCHSSTGSLDLGALVFKQSIPWVFYTISNIHEFLITQFLQGRKCLFWSIIKLNKDYVQGRKLLQVARKDSFLWYIGAEFCKWIDGGYPGRGVSASPPLVLPPFHPLFFGMNSDTFGRYFWYFIKGKSSVFISLFLFKHYIQFLWRLCQNTQFNIHHSFPADIRRRDLQNSAPGFQF